MIEGIIHENLIFIMSLCCNGFICVSEA